ncbi:transcription termination/antitermination factor NusG [Candidatus Beckwithbacteria bacterium]|nr:transcription termination/antitermination factor NusG [Candidatus Beckwithbacteria bacterium]
MNKKDTSKKIIKVKTKKPEVKPEEQVQAEELTVKPVASNHVIINETPNPKAHWYVVHTYSGHENKVATALKQKVESMDLVDYVLELLIPTQNRIKIAKGKKQTIAEKYLPGYMLVKMVLTDESWLVVRTTPGVTSFIGVGNRPTPISEEEVNAIKKFMEQEAPKYKATFTVGEAVKIVDGPFADFLGNVESIDQDKGKVKVLVSIFGRETPVELDFLQVAKI